MAEPYIHYADEVSLYSGKTRAYLRYKNISFREVTPTMEVYREVIVPAVKRPIIPLVGTPEGQLLQDTTVIIDALEQRHTDCPIYPPGPQQRLAALLLELFGDEWLVMPAMHYRWQYKRQNLRFILNEFGGMLKPGWPKLLHPVAGVAPAVMFGNMYKDYFGLRRGMHQAVEESYLGFLDEFNNHLAEHDFLFGSRPSIGDFGLIGPLYAHLYRDPAPGKLMKQRAPQVARWVERMQHPEPLSGEFLADDQVPETLMPILARQVREQFPVLADTVRRVGEWAIAHPDKRYPPRTLGSHRYTLQGRSAERKVQPYVQWMLQRPLRHYQTLPPEQKAKADRWLAPIGAIDTLSISPPVWLDYRQHRLQRAE